MTNVVDTRWNENDSDVEVIGVVVAGGGDMVGTEPNKDAPSSGFRGGRWEIVAESDESDEIRQVDFWFARLGR